MFFLLDRVTGEKVLSSQYLPSANWSLGFKPTGEPIPDPKKEPQIGGALVSPHNGGATNWAPPSYSPQTGLFYVNTVEGYVVHYRVIGADDGAERLRRRRRAGGRRSRRRASRHRSADR